MNSGSAGTFQKAVRRKTKKQEIKTFQLEVTLASVSRVMQWKMLIQHIYTTDMGESMWMVGGD